ncbi:MAG: stalk domain-containing protein [Candidatus Tumulicola sp.]
MTYRAPSWRTLAAVSAAAVFVSGLLAFSRPIEMMVDGEHVDTDVSPVAAVDHVFVPVRSMADALGAETLPGESDGRVEVVRGNQTLRLTVGDTHASINGMPLTLKYPPFRVRGRVMVELRAVATAFDVRASYDRRTARIDVLTPGIGQAAVPPRTTSPTQ